MSEIGVKLTGDNSEYRSMLSDSVEQGAEFGGKLTEKVGDKLFGLRDISHTVATALGLNLENIAENAARLFTGMSKEEEEFYKKSAEMSTQAADAAIANMRAQASEETRYQLLLKERDEAQARINKRNEESISIEQARAESAAVIAKRGAEYTEAQKQAELAAYARENAAMDQEATRAARNAANAEDAKKREAAIAELRAADAARAKADQDRFTQGEKDAADNRKVHDADQLKALEAADKITKDIFDTQSKEEAENEKLILQAKARAVAEAGILTEFEQQLVAIQKMAGAGTAGFKAGPNGGGVGTVTQQQLEDALANAKNAFDAAERNANGPDGARNLIEARALVDQAQHNRDVGRSQQGFGGPVAVRVSDLDLSSVSAVADAALGSRSDNAIAKATADAAVSAKAQVALSKNIDARLDDFFGSFGRKAPALADSPYASGINPDTDGGG